MTADKDSLLTGGSCILMTENWTARAHGMLAVPRKWGGCLKFLELSRPPKRRARWVVAHPIVGALALGIGWGAFMAVWMSVTTRDSVSIPVALILGVVLFGPAMVSIMRRGIRRWDAEHG